MSNTIAIRTSIGCSDDLVRDPRGGPLYLFQFIEVFYNRQRHETALGHHTAAQFAATFSA